MIMENLKKLSYEFNDFIENLGIDMKEDFHRREMMEDVLYQKNTWKDRDYSQSNKVKIATKSYTLIVIKDSYKCICLILNI